MPDQEVWRLEPLPDHTEWWEGFLAGAAVGFIVSLGVIIVGLYREWW